MYTEVQHCSKSEKNEKWVLRVCNRPGLTLELLTELIKRHFGNKSAYFPNCPLQKGRYCVSKKSWVTLATCRIYECLKAQNLKNWPIFWMYLMFWCTMALRAPVRANKNIKIRSGIREGIKKRFPKCGWVDWLIPKQGPNPLTPPPNHPENRLFWPKG